MFVSFGVVTGVILAAGLGEGDGDVVIVDSEVSVVVTVSMSTRALDCAFCTSVPHADRNNEDITKMVRIITKYFFILYTPLCMSIYYHVL